MMAAAEAMMTEAAVTAAADTFVCRRHSNPLTDALPGDGATGAGDASATTAAFQHLSLPTPCRSTSCGKHLILLGWRCCRWDQISSLSHLVLPPRLLLSLPSRTKQLVVNLHSDVGLELVFLVEKSKPVLHRR